MEEKRRPEAEAILMARPGGFEPPTCSFGAHEPHFSKCACYLEILFINNNLDALSTSIDSGRFGQILVRRRHFVATSNRVHFLVDPKAEECSACNFCKLRRLRRYLKLPQVVSSTLRFMMPDYPQRPNKIR